MVSERAKTGFSPSEQLFRTDGSNAIYDLPEDPSRFALAVAKACSRATRGGS